MAEFMKDWDLYLGGGNTSADAQTGHPCTVVPFTFEARALGGGGGGRGRGAAAVDSTTPPPAPQMANSQPYCTTITGNLYNDDVILSVAHKYQVNTRWHLERPKLG
jgi:hypothetical protein